MATVNGSVIGIPALVDNLAVVYNKKLFAAAGLPVPTASWTWPEFVADAQKLTKPAIKQYGTAYVTPGSEDTVWHWEALLWEAGGALLSANGKQAAFNSPLAWRHSTPCGPWPSLTSPCTWTRPTPPTPTCSTQARSGCSSPGPGTCRPSPTWTTACRSCPPTPAVAAVTRPSPGRITGSSSTTAAPG